MELHILLTIIPAPLGGLFEAEFGALTQISEANFGFKSPTT